jgi:hypothetical protein
MNTLIEFARAAAMTMTVVVNLATIAVALGTFALIYSQNLLTGFLVALTALISGTIGYGYSVWRMHKAGSKTGLTPTTA